MAKRQSWQCERCAQRNPLGAERCADCEAWRPLNRKCPHRLVCPICDASVYTTVSQLETRGLPPCWCGELFQPATIDLALHLGADDAPIAREFFDREARKNLAQKPARIRASRMGRDPLTLPDMSAKALDETRELQREQARKRRLALFVPAPEPMPF